jgi:O-acetyl-ADP-ribose deacetylase (regulator of RNase III)
MQTMIRRVKGNLLDAKVEALVNAVNCVGVMGKGLALEFKKAFPANYSAYREACKRGKVQPGMMFVFQIGNSGQPRFIINFPTKRHWRSKSQMEDIESGLTALVEAVKNNKVRSLAVPALGCGHGGLDWSDVRERMQIAFQNLPDGTDVHLYEP